MLSYSSTSEDAPLQHLQAQLLKLGLDIFQPFCSQHYNSGTPPTGLPLPSFGRACTLALLIGNTRALWPCFVAHLRQNPGCLDREHPLDDYVTAGLTSAVASAALGQSETRLGHTFPGPVGFVDLLRAAHVSGLAFHNDDCHLCIHPTVGPWFGLRAVLILDFDGSRYAGREPCPGQPASCVGGGLRSTITCPPHHSKAASTTCASRIDGNHHACDAQA